MTAKRLTLASVVVVVGFCSRHVHTAADETARAQSVAGDCAEPKTTTDIVQSIAQRNGWQVVETANFRLWSPFDRQFSAALAKRCEALRTELLSKWWPQSPREPWAPRAEIVIHASAAEYARALGTSGTESSGCTTIQFDEGRAICRRIDLRGDAPGWNVSSLGHEMTHLVVAERFQARAATMGG
jgi:hypothetical protein